MNKTFLIAEIGINHDGNLKKSLSLVRSAKKSGADAVKFQFFLPSDLYIKNSIGYNQLTKCYLSFETLKKIKKFCDKIKIKFICTPFSLENFNLLQKLKLSYYKIASMDFDNQLLVDKILKSTKSKILISTGMTSLKELKLFKMNYRKHLNRFIIMHCISLYPTKIKDVNLITISYLKKIFPKNNIGFSDHTIGNNVMKLSLNYGVNYIEKHFTYNKSKKGADHILSAEDKDLIDFRKFELDFYKSRGSNIYLNNIRPDRSNVKKFRRGLYFSKDINKGTKVLLKDLNFVRPYNDFSATQFLKLKSKILKMNVKKNMIVKEKYFL
jgi:N,N'-diacetyllegionaminate synthase